MPTSRSYADSCGAAHGLDLVGERWALLVVRELLLGPKRFSDLRQDLPGISSNILSSRLDELERAGVVGRRRLPPPAASAVYELTAWGRELEPVVCSLGRWAARSPLHRKDLHLSTTSLVLSLRTNFDAARAAGADLDVALDVGGDVFRARVTDGTFAIARGESDGAEVVVAADARTFAGLVYGGLPLEAAVDGAAATVSGDLDAARAFFGVFSLPAPAEVAAAT